MTDPDFGSAIGGYRQADSGHDFFRIELGKIYSSALRFRCLPDCDMALSRYTCPRKCRRTALARQQSPCAFRRPRVLQLSDLDQMARPASSRNGTCFQGDSSVA